MTDLADLDAALDAVSASLVRDLADAWDAITREQERILTAWTVQERIDLRRAQLRQLQADVLRLMQNARTVIRANLPEAMLAAHGLGVEHIASELSTVIRSAGVDLSALSTLTQDAYGDLLQATRHVEDTTKELVRALVREHVRDKLAVGQTPAQAARALKEALKGEGIAAIVYKDGSRHGLAEYSRMVVRTKTAEAYQRGGIEAMRHEGVKWAELLDGPGCGLDGHNGFPKADGLILPLDQAARFPISHPNCRRSTTPRPDIDNAGHARTESGLTKAEYDQALALQPSPGGTSSLLNERTARAADGTLKPQIGAATSAAERRNAARVARVAARDSAAAPGTAPSAGSGVQAVRTARTASQTARATRAAASSSGEPIPSPAAVRARAAQARAELRAAQAKAKAAAAKVSSGDPAAQFRALADGTMSHQDALALVKARMDFTDPATGLRVEMHDAVIGARGVYRADGQVVHGRNTVGTIQRTFHVERDGSLTVSHDYFTLAKQFEGQGFAARWFAQLFDWYREAGVARVTVHADIDVGGYAWAKAGYQWDIIDRATGKGRQVVLDQINGLLARLRHNLNRDARADGTHSSYPHLGPALSDARLANKRTLDEWQGLVNRIYDAIAAGDGPGARSLLDDLPTPYDLAMLGWEPGAEMWPGKAGLLGSDWLGVITL